MITNESNQIDTNRGRIVVSFSLIVANINIWYFTVQYVCSSIRSFVRLFVLVFRYLCGSRRTDIYKEDSIYLCLFPYLSVCVGRMSRGYLWTSTGNCYFYYLLLF